MSDETEKILKENSEIKGRLLYSLDRIIYKFNGGIIPGNPEKEETIELLNEYIESRKRIKENNKRSFVYNKKNDKKDFNEEIITKELQNSELETYLLLKLANEKIISAEDLEMSSEYGTRLIEEGFCDELISGNDDKYYVLSYLGEKTLCNRKVMSTIHSVMPTAVFPRKLLYKTSEWTDLYFKRIILLNDYFKKIRNSAEYLVVSLNDTSEMVYGCALIERVEVEYVFPAIFGIKPDEDIEELRKVVSSDEVDRMVIAYSSDGDRNLIQKAGINSENYAKIVFERA